jgi:hypothetical protein
MKGGAIHNFQVATSEGPQMLPNWTKRLGSGGRWRELGGAVEGGGNSMGSRLETVE